MHLQLHLKSCVRSWFYFQQIFPLGNTGRCKITSTILWFIPFCIAFCIEGRGIRQFVFLCESSMANQGWCGNHVLDSYHFIPFLPMTLSYLHILQHGSEVLGHRLLERWWICWMNAMENVLDTDWVSLKHICLLDVQNRVKAKQRVWVRKQTAERGVKYFSSFYSI